MSDYSIYPRAIDGYAQIPFAVDKKTPINAESVNRLRSGIINIEKALGVSPQYSDKYGEFADLGERLVHTEDALESLEGIYDHIGLKADVEISAAAQRVESELYEVAENLNITLTDLYERDPNIIASGEPLRVWGDTPFSVESDTFSIDLNLEEKASVKAKGSSLFLGATGAGDTGFPGLDSAPHTTILSLSDKVLLESFSPDYEVSLRTYCYFGGAFADSDLAILKTERKHLETGSVLPTPISFIAGLNAGADPTKAPSGMEFSIARPSGPEFHSPDIGFYAPGTEFEDRNSGSIEMLGGNGPLFTGSSFRLGGSYADAAGSVQVLAGSAPGLDGDGPEGPAMALNGSTNASSGGVLLRAGTGTSDIPGGSVEIRAGDGSSGGSLSLSSGMSANLAPSTVTISAPPSVLGHKGQVRIVGETTFYSKARLTSVSKAIGMISTSNDGSDYYIDSEDYTLIASADSGPLLVHTPASPVDNGRIICVKMVDNTFPVTIMATSSSVDNMPSYTLGVLNEAVTIQFSGGRWFIINKS